MSYEEVNTGLTILNHVNGADRIVHEYVRSLPGKFGNNITAVFMGIAYGGDVEAAAKELRGKGQVYGYDTFEDMHPRHLAVSDDDREATCMEGWYEDSEFGKEKLSYEYQSNYLKNFGLDNAHLIKGEVISNSCEDLDEIHFAFLDMDILSSMQTGYEAVRDKIVPDGYLFLHDVTSETNLIRLYKWFYDFLLVEEKHLWKIEGIWPKEQLGALRRK